MGHWETRMGSEVQGPWGLSRISGMGHGAPGRKDPEVRWAEVASGPLPQGQDHGARGE